MAVEVRRKKGETFDSLLRRFKRRIHRSGKLLQAKKVRFHASPESKSTRKRSALHRISVKERLAYLEKIGKLPEEEPRQRGGQR